MRYYNIAVLCEQETHVAAAPIYDMDGVGEEDRDRLSLYDNSNSGLQVG